jgi:hypothetical protein
MKLQECANALEYLHVGGDAQRRKSPDVVVKK